MFDWNWKMSDLVQDKPVKVFSTFSCGGGSSLGYKRAGFEVIGNVEIDPKINDLYIINNHPKYNYCEDLRAFNNRDDLPEELFGIDILDGSPPCTSFSTAGVRERDWGKKKKFREGQTTQTLDDLFFVFLDTVEKLRPKIVVAENVVGIVKGKAKGYVNEIIKRFHALGYQVQIFSLNAAYMDVPQARHRVFFVANRMSYSKLCLEFHHPVIKFGEVRTKEKGSEVKAGVMRSLLEQAIPEDISMADVTERLTGEKNKYYTNQIFWDRNVARTLTSNGLFFRGFDKTRLSDEDFRRVQSFPSDYNFKNQNVQYVCGMSVPPNMMANVALEIWNQWLKSK